MSVNWHLVSFKPGQDHTAAKGLRDQKFTVYLAKLFWTEKHAGRRLVCSKLRLPGYGFVSFDHTLDEHGPISNTRGVAQLYCNPDGVPRVIPARFITRLRSLEDEEMDSASKPPKDQASLLEPGVKVRIDRHENFQGLTGMLLESYRGKSDVLIGSFIINISDADLTVIEPHKEKQPKKEKVSDE